MQVTQMTTDKLLLIFMTAEPFDHLKESTKYFFIRIKTSSLRLPAD
jgi:hypothetical protein